MLKLYNASGGFVRMISDTDYTDLSIVSTLKDGDKQLSFTYLNRPSTLQNEGYVLTDTDRYVIKELRPAKRSTQVVCKLDLEALEKDMFQQFTAANKTVAQMAALALVGTGWTVTCSMTKKRSVQCYKKTPLEILYKITEAFMCELSFDTVNKVVTFAEQLGSDKGVYFRTDLNLQSLSPTYDSYDYYTRLIPIGADGLTIESVNSGKNYVENTTYSSKVRTLIWEDTSYEDATELKTDAIGKLSDMAAPKRSYSAQIIDFARLRGDTSMAFALGDTILITDEATQTMEKQRIVKITEYPDAPEKNSVELSNTTLTWEEMQARYQKAAQAWEDVSNSDGTVNGVYVHGVQAGDVVGVEVTTGSGTTKTDLNTAVSTVQSSISVVASDLQAATARIGTIETTYLQATMANLDTANITTAKIKDLFLQVGLIKQAQIEGAKITGYLDAVKVNASDITTGTLTTDRLVIRGTNKSIVYALNNISGALQSQNVNTINGEILTERTINADKIVAGAITANEIAASTITANKLNIGTLSAISANMGSITAGNIQVKTVIGSDTYLGILRTSGGSAPPSGNGIRMFEITKDTGSTGTYDEAQFCVGTDGYLYARNANIRGTITADTLEANGGTIANWNITRSNTNTGKSADGGHAYSTSLYGHASDENYEYEVGMKADSGSGGYLAFYVKRIAAGAMWSTAVDRFYVRNNGSLFAANADITGKITATSGTIGGWSIGEYVLKSTDSAGALTSGLQASGRGNWAFAIGAPDTNDWSTAPFRIDHAGNVYASKINVISPNVYSDMWFKDGNTLQSMIATNGKVLVLNGHYVTSYVAIGTGTVNCGTFRTTGAATFDSTISVTGNVHINNQTTTDPVRFRLTNSQRIGAIQITNTGAFGLYDLTASKWLIYSNSSEVVIPNATTVSARMTFSNAPVVNNNIYYCSKNTDGTVVPVLGWSSGNNMWVGHYTFANRSNRINLGATIDKLYVYNSSGSTVLLSTQVSDRRLKHDISNLQGAYDLIMSLKAKEFRYNGEAEDRKHYGFVAQDVRPLIPEDSAILAYNPIDIETGKYDADDESTFEYSMSYTELIAPMVSVIQDQERQIKSLKEDLSELREMLATLIEQTA